LTITAGVQYPSGVGIDATGKIYVLDQPRNASGSFTGSNVTTYTQQGASTSPAFSLAAAFGTGYVNVLSVGALGESFFGAWQEANFAGQVAEYDAGGYLTGLNFMIPSNAPQGIAITPVGNYYVANNAYLGDCSVVEYTLYEGRTTPTIDVPAPDCDGGVAVDAAGKIYLTLDSNAVRTYNADGSPATPTITDGLNFPGAIAVDALGTIYVANTGNNTITAYNPDGTRTKPTITLDYEPTAIAVY
jgi:DNA-binding beta-propeller fold protein YncE